MTVSGGAEPRVVVPFSAPVYGVLEATVDTAVRPDGGSMVIGRNGARLGTYPIRTDGTFALPTDKLLVGLHDDLQVYYDGDAAYAPTPLRLRDGGHRRRRSSRCPPRRPRR